MSEQIVNLGQPPAADAKRDAVHIAVIPQVATKRLKPGSKVDHGVVDPFRTSNIPVGGTYWLFLTPGTAANLRHQWDHPHFPEEKSEREEELEKEVERLENLNDYGGCRGC